MRSWGDVDRFLLDSAADDLARGSTIIPCVVAFQADTPLFFAGLRDFAKGEYHHPMIELLALSGALGADRLAAAFPGRAWSWDDPVPPVVEGVGDMRQRVLVATFVDATSTPTRRTSTIAPYDVDGNSVIWHEPLRNEVGEGWVSEALTVAAESREQLLSDADGARAQALRCQQLGHLLGFSPSVVSALGLTPAPNRR